MTSVVPERDLRAPSSYGLLLPPPGPASRSPATPAGCAASAAGCSCWTPSLVTIAVASTLLIRYSLLDRNLIIGDGTLSRIWPAAVLLRASTGPRRLSVYVLVGPLLAWPGPCCWSPPGPTTAGCSGSAATSTGGSPAPASTSGAWSRSPATWPSSSCPGSCSPIAFLLGTFLLLHRPLGRPQGAAPGPPPVHALVAPRARRRRSRRGRRPGRRARARAVRRAQGRRRLHAPRRRRRRAPRCRWSAR